MFMFMGVLVFFQTTNLYPFRKTNDKIRVNLIRELYSIKGTRFFFALKSSQNRWEERPEPKSVLEKLDVLYHDGFFFYFCLFPVVDDQWISDDFTCGSLGSLMSHVNFIPTEQTQSVSSRSSARDMLWTRSWPESQVPSIGSWS